MPKKILVVDDERGMVELLKDNLEARNYLVSTASDGRGALEKALNETPDLILLDILIPGLDGFEVLRRLRHSVPTSQTPVIIISAKRESTFILAAQHLGATDYLIKPLSMKSLLALVRKQLWE